MSDFVRPHRWQPTRLSRPWDSLGKNTGVGCHYLLQCVKVKSESKVAQLCPTLSDPMDCSPPGSPLPWDFSKQEYRSRLPGPPPRDLPHPRIETASLCLLHWQAGSLPSELPGKHNDFYFVLLDCFSLFLCFLGSLIECILWNSGRPGGKALLQTRRQAGDTAGQVCPGRPRRHLPSYSGEEPRPFSTWYEII